MKKLLTMAIPYLLVVGMASYGYADVIFSENFTSGLPVNWTVVDSSWDVSGGAPAGSDLATWGPDTRVLDYMSGTFMMYDSDSACPKIARDQLITPVINCSTYVDVVLKFSNNYQYSWSGAGDVDIRVNGGAWQNMAHYSGSDNEGNIQIDISSLADLQDSVEVRWYYYDAQCDDWWAIDSVVIEGTAVYNDDIAAVSIDEPSGMMHVNTPYTPKVTVQNVGTTAQTFDLRLVITNSVLLEEVYNDTVIGISLDPLNSSQAVFSPDFTPTSEDSYTFTATVLNPGDEDNSNDVATEAIPAYQHYGDGGPDSFGYTWKDNTVTGGPAFSYIDISGTGTVIGDGNDTGFGPLPIGFSFPFYESVYTDFYVNTNGLVTLGELTNTRFNYCPVPDVSTPDFWIAPFWDDLRLRSSDNAKIYYQYFDDDIDYLVIQWHNFCIYGEYGDPMEMEAILYADGMILFQYDYINDLDDGHGQAATVGIEKDASDGLSYLCNDDHPGNRLYSGLAVGWYPPVVNHDVGVVSIDNPTAPLVVTGANCNVTATIENYGVGSETFDVYLEVENSSAVTVFADTVNLTIASGNTDQAIFSSWAIGAADNYTITVTTDLPGDEISGNNALGGSIKAVDKVSMPMVQDFEGTFPPEGWTVFDFSGSGSWTTNTNHYHSPTHSAQVSYDWFEDTDDWLVLAPIDMLLGSNVTWLYYEEDSESNPFSQNGLRHSFYISTDIYFDPATATLLAVHTPADHTINDFSGEPVELDLSPYSGNSVVWLAYRQENARQIEYWWIDDVNIFNVPNADVGVHSIDFPLPAIIENCDSPVEVTVKNYGLEAQTFDVSVTITGNTLGEVYSEAVNVAGLEPDSSEAVALPDFTEPRIDEYLVNATVVLPADENMSNNTMTKEIRVDTIIVHTWDDDEADGSITPYPFDNSMLAVKYTPFAENFTIMGGGIYVNQMSGDENEYAEFEWVKICPDAAGVPDLDNAYGTVDSIGTYEANIPILIPIGIVDVPVTGYTGDIWIVAKYWDGSNYFLSVATDSDDPDENSYYTLGNTPPVWQQDTNRDYMMRIDARYEPCALPGYAYLPGDVNMYNGVWPPAPIVGADATYLINFFRGFTTSHPCFMNNPGAPVLWPNGQPGQYFWASADVNGDCQVIGADVTKLINYLRGSGTLSWCVEYEPAWHDAGELPAEAPAGWPNCATPPPLGGALEQGVNIK
jgi:hypothetical protein